MKFFFTFFIHFLLSREINGKFSVMGFWGDFISLLYPRLCAACGNTLWVREEVICTYCDFHLPKTFFHLDPENPVHRIFWGRIPLEGACAMYYFQKGNRVQQMIHELKYRGRREVGVTLGRKYGLDLKSTPFIANAGIIIPVPLHYKKQRKRGYNQSEVFASGLSFSLGIPMDARILVRTRASETQTRKSRFSRWQNVSEIFRVEDPATLLDRHVLLVDDVITTGATLEACAAALMSVPGVRISIAAIAAALR
jgi:ComF family protein